MNRPVVPIAVLILVGLIVAPLARAETRLRVGVYQNRPLVFMEHGRAQGIYPDLIDYLAAREGWEVEYLPCEWNDCLKYLERGELDLMTGIAYTKERTKRFAYNWENVIIEWGQIYARPDSNLKSILDLEGKKIAVLTGDIFYESLRNLVKRFNINCRFIEAPELEWVLDMVAQGRVAAGAVNRLYGVQFTAGYDLVATPIIYYPVELRFAAYKGLDKNILAAIDNQLIKLKKDKSSIYHRTLDRWLGQGAVARRFPAWLKWALAAAGLGALWALATAIYLRVQVRRRTAELKAKNEELEASLAEQRRVERELQVQKARLERLFSSAPEGIAIVDQRDVALQVNEEFTRMFGYPAEEVIGRPLNDLIVPADKIEESNRITELVWAGEDVAMETVRHRKDGSLVQVSLLGTAIKLGEGQIGAFLIYRDVTERKEAEAALASERERLAVTLRSIGDGVITTDTEGRITLVNRAAEALTGWRQSEALGRNLEEVLCIFDQHSGERCRNPVERAMALGRAVTLERNAVLKTRDGREIFIADSCAPIRDWESRIVGVVVVFRDATSERQREQEQLRADKMDSLGVLAGGIAHDFNNILSGVIGHISLAKFRAASNEELVATLNEAEKAALRAKGLTRQLLTFSSGGAPIKVTASIAEILIDSLGFALRGSNVTYTLELEEELWPVEADAEQISQVMNNLIINADQAMPDGGLVRVDAVNTELEPGNAFDLKPGRYVAITIKDQGPGISPEHQSKIFDPYFTTKDSGSGLGLSTAYSIVARHGGHLSVVSELGQGAVFTVYLPASDKAAPPPESREGGLMIGQGRVLVMDDEKVVTDVACEMLGVLGYEAVGVANGEEALERYAEALEAGRPFDVVLMDLTIPGGMGGKEALAKLKEIDPQVKAIVSSGYSNDPLMSRFAEYGFSGVVAKPYRLEDLAAAVKKVLNEPRR